MTVVAGAPPVAADRGRDTEILVEVRDLQVEYGVAHPVRAVDGVDLQIRAGEIVGLAGESGCGKSTVANAVMQILRPPARVVGGSVLFRGEDLVGKSSEQLRKFRWRNVSMVFQSAMNGLNPVMRVGAQFVDMMQAHERISRHHALTRAGELLELVGIDPRRVRAYPHQLSGGMRQRVIIAMALALEPELVIMDEPTTALDVVVQREILQQIQDLQKERGFAVLFITHDLSLLIEVADRIAIMYAGEIVETAPRRPCTPRRGIRTRSVCSSRSLPSGPRMRMTGIPGSPPDLADPPGGCRFHPRCPYWRRMRELFARQVEERPELREIEPAHFVACHRVEAGL